MPIAITNGIHYRPSYIITPENTHWLIYGSWHSGIVAMELNAETGMPKQELRYPLGRTEMLPAEYGQLIATRNINNRWQASEGPEIIYNTETGYYYLFVHTMHWTYLTIHAYAVLKVSPVLISASMAPMLPKEQKCCR